MPFRPSPHRLVTATVVAATLASAVLAKQASTADPATATPASPAAPATDAQPADDRLRGELVFSNADGTNWFVAKGEEQGSAFAEFATTASALPQGDEWTTPVVGGTGPLIRTSDDGCLTDDTYGVVYHVLRCDGSPEQQFAWTTIPGGTTLQNPATGRYLSTGALDATYSDYLQGFPRVGFAGLYDLSRLTPDGGGAVTPPANGGIDALGQGTPASVAPGGTTDVFVGMRTTSAITALHATTITVQAPVGTTFDPALTALDGALRPASSDAWATQAALRAAGSVSADGRTFTGTIAEPTAAVQLPEGADLRWRVPLTASATATPGTSDLTFTIAGTTN
ncbi:hypothetical protein [Microbacterium sp. M1A1_1b]